jgi:FHA domain
MGVISFRPGSGLLVAGQAGTLYVVSPNDGPLRDALIATVLETETDLIDAAIATFARHRLAVGTGFVIVEPIGRIQRTTRSIRVLLHGQIGLHVVSGELGEQTMSGLTSGADGEALVETVEDVAWIVCGAGGTDLYQLGPGSVAPAGGFTYRSVPVVSVPVVSVPVVSVPVASVPMAARTSWLVSDAAGSAPSPWAPEALEAEPNPARPIHSIDDAPTWAKDPTPATTESATDATTADRRTVWGRLLLDDGDAIDLRQPVVFGRFPSPKLLVDGEEPHAVKLVDAEKRVSQQHLIVRFDGRNVVVEDQRSTNGTTVRERGGADVRLEPGASVTLQDGMVVTMAKRRSFRFVAAKPTAPHPADAALSNG